MQSSVRGLLGAGGAGSATGLLWYLLEMTARFAHDYHSGGRPPADYLTFLVYYTFAGFFAGIAVFVLGRGATRVASSGNVAVRATIFLAVAASVLAILFTRGAARSAVESRALLDHLGVAVFVSGILAAAAWGLVRSKRRYGIVRLLAWGTTLALLLFAGHLVFLHTTALDRVLEGYSSPDRRTHHPDVLLVSVDTLRADRLHSYGYSRKISPNLDRLAREGVLFEQAIAHSPWTQPSLATILTSTYPSQHGSFVLLAPAEEGGGARAENILYQSFLPGDEVTLAELLAERGYTTIAVQSLCANKEVQRFDQGFQVYLCESRFVSSMWEESLLGLIIKKGARFLGARAARRSDSGLPEADAVYRSFRALISRVLPRPFFIWVHFRDPHSPYLRRQDGVPLENALVVDSLMPENAEVPTAALSEAYDDEVRFVDHYIGRTLGLLRDRGVLDDTVVVLTSDHGEEFEDHFAEAAAASAKMRGRFHGHSLYSELLRVPLVIRYPPRIPPGTRVASLARHVDLVPTILDLAGIDAGSLGDRFEGRSLMPLVTGGEDEGGSRLAYSERNLFGPQRRSIQDGRYKLILEIESGRTELYDLAVDPGEQENLAAVRREEAERLLSLLDRWAARMGPVVPPPSAAAPDADALEALRALGYVP